VKHVTIIGGGITGLAAAYYLQREVESHGLPIRYTLVESDARWGGKILTEYQQSFTIEAGPDSFVVDKPEALQLCRDIGLDGELIPSNEKWKRVYVLRRGRLIAIPDGFRLTIPTAARPFLASRLFSPVGKLRMAMDLIIPPRRDASDESLASFIRRRFGNECLERLAGPLLGGIYVADPERLSVLAAFPRLREMEQKHGSLIRAARAARDASTPAAGPRPAGRAMFNSLRRGMGSIAETLAEKLTGDLRLRCESSHLEWRDRRIRVFPAGSDGWNTDAVILAIPANRAADLIDDCAPELGRELASLRFVSTAVITMAYRMEDIPSDRPLDGFGVLIPPAEKRALIAVTWTSSKFEHRAPPGYALLRAFVGGYRDEERAFAPDDLLFGMARREFRHLFGIRAEPILARIYRWPQANPQYDVGHKDRVARIESYAAALPGLYLAGGSYYGIGIPDCIRSARRAVSAVLAKLISP
jgi:oxygen-dependent protoporphyrinogen oxidase